MYIIYKCVPFYILLKTSVSFTNYNATVYWKCLMDRCILLTAPACKLYRTRIYNIRPTVCTRSFAGVHSLVIF